MSLILFFKSHVGAYLRGGKMVNVAGYQGKTARGTPSAGQRSLFDEPQHAEPTRELVAEHEHLVDVLRSPSHADDKVEAGKQAEELKEMKQEQKPESESVTVSSRKRVKVPEEGTHTEVTLTNGKVLRIQRLNSGESMGLPGWHSIDGDGGFLADTEDEAIKVLIERAVARPKILFVKPSR